MNINKKVIVVTGATSGIGRQLVNDLLVSNIFVVIISRNEIAINQVIKDVSSDNMAGYPCDITNQASVEDTFKRIYDKFGKVYGLVNNAGINPSRNNITNTSLEDWHSTLNVNLTGAFNCSKSVINCMYENKCGSIVNISSIAGITALSNRASYMASKSGLIGLSHSMAKDYAKYNIRVNCVCPGYVHTPLVKEYLMNLSKQDKDNLIKRHLLGRFGNTKDISKAIMFLLSEDSSWITGIVLPVDGGYSIS